MILIYDNGTTYLIDESELYEPFPKDDEPPADVKEEVPLLQSGALRATLQ